MIFFIVMVFACPENTKRIDLSFVSCGKHILAQSLLILMVALLEPVAATATTGSASADSMLHRVEQSQRDVDSALKKVEAYFDSINERDAYKIDTQAVLNYRLKVLEQEKRSEQQLRIIIGTIVVVALLAGLFFWRKKRKMKKAGARISP